MSQMEINLSHLKALPFDFGGAVDAHIKALQAHRTTEHAAAPTAHPLVERAISRVQYPVTDGKPDDFVPNYKVVDDSPSLDDRKMALVQSLTDEATRLMAGIMPPLKQDLWNLQYADAVAVEDKKRTSAQNAAIKLHEDRIAKVRAIHMHLAQMKSDIHDLTESTIEKWKAAPFPT